MEGFDAIAGMVICASIVVLYFALVCFLGHYWEKQRRAAELEEAKILAEQPEETFKPKKTKSIRQNAGIKRASTL